ncbi:hypothetical protein D9758_002039 [Tetrapyrgos nigripes]|uniref:Uncharacterized protein n=1 Tax=Tetrapyrgos nigripes TaxID=182062 RepID=A0A8H5GTU4_9AGAR|nr:hypothetical protein D9758_002039 [Tetrapyrgos nigripes]
MFQLAGFRFIGAIVRKQVFVQIYAYFTYVHFFINVAVAAYLLYIITHVSETAVDKLCDNTIKNAQGQEQCGGVLKFARGVYLAVAALVLLIELYGALIVTRYLNQIQNEKRAIRESYRLSSYAFTIPKQAQYSNLSDQIPSESHSSPPPPLSPKWKDTEVFDPYQGNSEHPRYDTSYTGFAYDSVPTVEEGHDHRAQTHH